MDNFIWHNPRCSKSRQTLQLIENAGVAIEVVHYLETPPTAAALQAACAGMSCPATAIIRSKEALFKELGLSLKDERSDADWFEILQQNPRLIERPIVHINGRYVMGRPPENVETLL